MSEIMNIYETEGIFYDGDICEWHAFIKTEGEKVYLGSYSDVEGAFNARKFAESEQEPDPDKSHAILENAAAYLGELAQEKLRIANALNRQLEIRKTKGDKILKFKKKDEWP